VRLYRTVNAKIGVHSPIGQRQVREERYGFIDVSWIIRSVFLSPTFVKAGEYFVSDLVDSDANSSDIYLRLRELSIKGNDWY
jgi:hypothetical protein